MSVSKEPKLVASRAKQWAARLWHPNQQIRTGQFPTKFRNVNSHNVMKSICQIIPEMSYIPDKYVNLALMSSLSVQHEDRIKILVSLQFNKLTRCYILYKMHVVINLSSREKKRISFQCVRESKNMSKEISTYPKVYNKSNQSRMKE